MNNGHLDFKSAVLQAKDFIQENRFENGFDLATPEGYQSYLADFAGSLASYQSWTGFSESLLSGESCEFIDQEIQHKWNRNVDSLISGAETDVRVFQALLRGVASEVEKGAELHPELRKWIAQYLRGQILPPSRKGHPGSSGLHNVIAHAVADLEESGMKPTVRGQYSPAVSACDAVVDALAESSELPSLTFGTVRGIWQKWKKSFWIR